MIVLETQLSWKLMWWLMANGQWPTCDAHHYVHTVHAIQKYFSGDARAFQCLGPIKCTFSHIIFLVFDPSPHVQCFVLCAFHLLYTYFRSRCSVAWIYRPLRARTIYVHPALPWLNRVTDIYIDYFEINANYYARLPSTRNDQYVSYSLLSW